MRIFFGCGSFEPGKDGVADYVARLANALSARGHPTCVAAFHDPFIQVATEQHAGAVPVIRLPRVIAWNARVRQVREYLRQWRADWFSLQFVIYAYHPKGLPLTLGGRISEIAGPIPLHVMFHELWAGSGMTSPRRLAAWRIPQRALIRHFGRKWKPQAVHTSNAWFQHLLAGIGIDSGLLPVFSNVPVAKPGEWFATELRKLGIGEHDRSRTVVAGFFGAIHDEWITFPWLDYLVDRAGTKGRRLVFLGIGKCSEKGRQRFLEMRPTTQAAITCHHFGERNLAHISEFLQGVDFGISTIEASLLGKSGTAAAMRAHGLPILVTRVDDQPDRDSSERRVRQDIDLLLDTPGRARMAPAPDADIEATAIRFLQDLTMARGGRLLNR